MPLLPPPYTPRKQSSSPARSGTVTSAPRNRTLSVRTSKSRDPTPPAKKHFFAFSSFRSTHQPDLSRRMFRLIKSENAVVSSYEAAGRSRQSIASQLSEWGEQTGDDAVSELSDKLAVILQELGAQELAFAQGLEDYRGVLKQIRNTESSVQPSREHKARVNDEILKARWKEPTGSKVTTLEQELVRAEAENLVAEAQLTNVTRAKLKEAYASHFATVIERAEKQIILAKHGRRILNLLDDTPVVPGDSHPAFEGEKDARQILHDAEEELKNWTLAVEGVTSMAHPVVGGVVDGKAAASATSGIQQAETLGVHPAHRGTGKDLGVHPALRKVSAASSSSGSVVSNGAGPSSYYQEERRRGGREAVMV
ncbi:hypothetical protein RUND412_006588 [Rhizina undulata]